MDSESKRYTVVIQSPATEMLMAHARFLAQVSESAATRLIDEFVSKAKSLEHMPERCPWLTDAAIPHHKYRKLIFENNFMLVFMIKDDSIYVDAMVDCRQDYRWLL